MKETLNTHFSYPLESIKARFLLQRAQHLKDVIIFYQGNRNSSLQNQAHYAVLAFKPSKKHNGKITQLNSVISKKTFKNKSQCDHFVAGWALCMPYSCGADYYLGSNSDDIYAHYYDYSLYLDLEQDQVFIQTYKELSQTQQQQIKQSILELNKQPTTELIKSSWQPLWDKKTYANAFNRVQKYLISGDIYQVNLAYPFHCPEDLTKQSPLTLFEHFQAPFCAYFSIEHKQEKRVLFSVSPERLIKVKDNKIEARPIKGTLPRGKNQEEDQTLINKLSQCPKNRAENLMIVDLLRNDVSESAKLNSVKVEPIFAVESYKNVHHLVSTVHAELKNNVSIVQLLKDVFPGGSITGAPKKRAIEIIQELEAQPRGLYCGSLGYIDNAGHADFNILIRSIEATSNGAYCWGGGGIVVDSNCEDEYQEIQYKIKSILNLAF